jgi:SurA N-terminal domain
MNESETQKEDTTTPVVPESTEIESSHDSNATHVDEAEEVSEPVETTVVTEEAGSSAATDDMAADEAVAASSEEAPAAAETAATTAAVTSAVALFHTSKEYLKRKKYTVATLVLVLIALLALMYALEANGKLNTGLFDGVQKQVSKHTAAATVNNEKISNYDLTMSMTQLTSGAAAQGADVTDPAVQTEIKTQALEMLINTELLKQEAANRGISVSEDDVNTRLETLKTDVGGEDVLNERMAEFGINQKTLLRDIKNELTIQKLLDEVFKEKSVVVTEEEIVAFYDQAGGAEAGLPGLDEVRAQIETQLKATKEQGVVTAYLEELRGKATIETLI